jgi:hypothetical protein
MPEFTEYPLAFEMSLDEAIEVGGGFLTADEMIAVMEARLAVLKQERLDG